jgi:quinol monooxygenase YgiN
MIYNNVTLAVTKLDDVENVKALLAEQARRSSEEPGCIRFEVYHSQTDVRQFLLIEQWQTQEDLDRHKEAKAFTELYIPKVIPLVSRDPHPSDLIWPEQ